MVRDIHRNLRREACEALCPSTPGRILATEVPKTVPVETPFVTRYSRQDVLRILHLRARQLQAWEQAGLIPANETYTFEDLGQLRTLQALRATRIRVKSIRESVDAMRKASGMCNPLVEASAVWHGSHLRFRHSGALVDPVTQQLAFDFEAAAHGRLRVVGDPGDTRAQSSNVQEMFQRAVQLEIGRASCRERV